MPYYMHYGILFDCKCIACTCSSMGSIVVLNMYCHVVYMVTGNTGPFLQNINEHIS